jgi:hypothetical protein
MNEEIEKLKKKYDGKYFTDKDNLSFVFVKSIFDRQTIDGEFEFFFIGTVITIDDWLKNNIDISKRTFNLFLSEPKYSEITITMWHKQVRNIIDNAILTI